MQIQYGIFKNNSDNIKDKYKSDRKMNELGRVMYLNTLGVKYCKILI